MSGANCSFVDANANVNFVCAEGSSPMWQLWRSSGRRFPSRMWLSWRRLLIMACSLHSHGNLPPKKWTAAANIAIRLRVRCLDAVEWKPVVWLSFGGVVCGSTASSCTATFTWAARRMTTCTRTSSCSSPHSPSSPSSWPMRTSSSSLCASLSLCRSAPPKISTWRCSSQSLGFQTRFKFQTRVTVLSWGFRFKIGFQIRLSSKSSDFKTVLGSQAMMNVLNKGFGSKLGFQTRVSVLKYGVKLKLF